MSAPPRPRVRDLGIDGVWAVTPPVHADGRGAFLEWFHAGRAEAVTGRPARIAQVNVSVSRLGVLRGIHYTDVPPGQEKYISCLKGAILDVAVDVRVGSPTFGKWAAIRLDDQEFTGVHVGAGIGHAFMALTDDTVVAYTCTQPYAPSKDHALNPLDPDLGIPWPADVTPVLSPGDRAAPTFAEAERAGLFPTL